MTCASRAVDDVCRECQALAGQPCIVPLHPVERMLREDIAEEMAADAKRAKPARRKRRSWRDAETRIRDAGERVLVLESEAAQLEKRLVNARQRIRIAHATAFLALAFGTSATLAAIVLAVTR